MRRSLCVRVLLSAALVTSVLACREEGKAEKAGRKFDEAIEKLRHGDEGAVEKAGRKLDEALEGAADEVGELREKAADAVEGK